MRKAVLLITLICSALLCSSCVSLEQGSPTLHKHQGGSKIYKYERDLPKGVNGKRQGWFQKFSQGTGGGYDEAPRR